jgi:hypothetical protein
MAILEKKSDINGHKVYGVCIDLMGSYCNQEEEDE